MLEHPDLGRAVLRDQKPLHPESLQAALGDDMTVEEWLDELDARVFFFVQRESLERLLGSPSYRDDEHDVLTLDTASLIAAHGDRIHLAAINTGFAQPHNHQSRGRSTFVPIAEYPHPERAVARVGKKRDLVELSVLGGLPDAANHVVKVERVRFTPR